MFIHGREAYRRNSLLVCYNFYKNVVYVSPQYWFGIFSVFSGQPLYEPWIYQMFNILFASAPIVWYALYDFQFKKEEFLTNSKHYSIGLNKECFSTKVFWNWVLYGFFHGLTLLMICLYCLEVTQNNTGSPSDLFTSGHFVYGGAVIIVTLNLANNMTSYHYIAYILCILSVMSFWVWLYLENLFVFFKEVFGIFTFIA